MCTHYNKKLKRRIVSGMSRFRPLGAGLCITRADCTHDAQTSTARSSPHCAHLLRRRRDSHFLLPKTFLPSYQRQRQMSEIFWLHLSLVTDGTFFPCSRPSKAFAQCGRRCLPMDCPEVQPHLGSRLNLLSVVRVTAINSFIFCFFQGTKYLAFFVFHEISYF